MAGLNFDGIPSASAVPPPRVLDFSGIPDEAKKDTSFSGDALVQNIRNLGAGAIKTAAGIGQLIPGMTQATDAIYGLPKGASSRATQPSNTGQKVGGFALDAVLAGATGAAMLPAGPITPGASVSSALVNMVEPITDAIGNAARPTVDVVSRMSHAALKGAYEGLVGKGPVTAEKIGALVAKYGVNAVKLAAQGLGLGAGYEAWRALSK